MQWLTGFKGYLLFVSVISKYWKNLVFFWDFCSSIFIFSFIKLSILLLRPNFHIWGHQIVSSYVLLFCACDYSVILSNCFNFLHLSSKGPDYYREVRRIQKSKFLNKILSVLNCWSINRKPVKEGILSSSSQARCVSWRLRWTSCLWRWTS